MSVLLMLPWPPSVNTYWRADIQWHPKQQRYMPLNKLSKKARAYRKAVAATVLDALGGRPEPMAGDLQVVLDYYPPDRRRRDIDNYAKGIFDALTHVDVWGDDAQIKQRAEYWHDAQKPGSVRIQVEEL